MMIEPFQLLLESIKNDTIFVLDPNGNVTIWGQGAEYLYGYKAEDVVGQHFSRFSVPEDRTVHKPERDFQVLMQQGHYEQECQQLRKDGSSFWADTRVTAIKNASGEFSGFINVTRDITKQKETENLLRQSQERLDILVEETLDGIFVSDLSFRFLDCNLAGAQMFGYSREEFLQLSVTDMIAEHEKPRYFLQIESLLFKNKVFRAEWQFQRKDGSFFYGETIVQYLSNAGRYQAVLRDITENKKLKDALSMMVEETMDGIFVNDPSFRFVECNLSGAQMLGYSREELLQLSITDIIPEHEKLRLLIEFERLIKDKVTRSEWQIKRKDGSFFFGEIIVKYLPDGRYQAVLRDITENRKLKEKLLQTNNELKQLLEKNVSQLQESEVRFRATFDQAAVGIAHIAPDGKWLHVNQKLCEIVGYTHRELLEKTFQDITHPEDLDKDLSYVHQMLEKQIETYSMEKRYFRKTGEIVWIQLTISLVWKSSGEPDYFIAVVENINIRKQAEKELKESEERFRQLAENIHEVFWMTNVEKKQMIYISPAYQEIWGRSTESLYLSPMDWLNAIHPQDQNRVREATYNQINGEFDEIYRILHPDGTLRWIRDRAFPIRDIYGNVYRIAGIAEDITETKKLEEEFRQSQKMEAIGQLAGGIAHDFNNMLSAIIGFSELAIKKLHSYDPLYKYLSEIKKAGERSATLTRQILAFSRKQILNPKIIEVNTLIDEMKNMLQRLIGEDIHLRIVLDPTAKQISADTGQFEQVLLNLVINAKDAMPQGGTLTLETKHIDIDKTLNNSASLKIHGPCIMLIVSDTGCGMDEKTQEHIFEPFFTTKEQGKGTGLGLSTVYGIVKQSGGYIRCSSKLGEGTLFNLYFPEVDKSLDTKTPGAIPISSLHGSETILLVEDEEAVRTVTEEILRSYGYQVLVSQDVTESFLICEQRKAPIDLVISDVVMPQMKGPEVVKRLKILHPEMKVLYISGYTNDIVSQHGLLSSEVAYLEKPFSPDILAHKIREILDS